MTIQTFDPGDKLFFQRTFTKAAGQSGTPVNVTVVLTVKDPAGATTTPAVTTNVVAGVATSTANTTIPAANTAVGIWFARWTCSQDIVSNERELFYVDRDPVL
jgi:hypothetical protein